MGISVHVVWQVQSLYDSPSAGTKGSMNHAFTDHVTNSRDVTAWIRIINMHLISLVFHAMHLHVFQKKTHLPYPESPDQTGLSMHIQSGDLLLLRLFHTGLFHFCF